MRGRTKNPIVKLDVRLPVDLHAKLKVETGGSPRNSINQEIIARLIESFKPHLTEEECKARYEAAADAYMRTIIELQDRLQKAERSR